MFSKVADSGHLMKFTGCEPSTPEDFSNTRDVLWPKLWGELQGKSLNRGLDFLLIAAPKFHISSFVQVPNVLEGLKVSKIAL